MSSAKDRVNSATGATAAGDDRTFIAGRRNTYGGITFFQVHVTPGAKQAATVKQRARGTAHRRDSAQW